MRRIDRRYEKGLRWWRRGQLRKRYRPTWLCRAAPFAGKPYISAILAPGESYKQTCRPYKQLASASSSKIYSDA